jgi:tRNA pseudouridine55 synthase
MESILVLDKQIGETPLECINRFRESHPDYRDIKMTYAGRLDPIASGVLLVLAGDMVHSKNDFLKLPKRYECTAILGIATDTYDVLGYPSASQSLGTSPYKGKDSIPELLKKYIGTFSQSYPPYSSKTINGKQMHTLARAGSLADLEIPTQSVTVEAISDIRITSVALEDICDEIVQIINRVTGDFRQQEIITRWNQLRKEHKGAIIHLVSFTIDVSGGTYIRGIVHELGQKLDPTAGRGACIIRLNRKSVGRYVLDK